MDHVYLGRTNLKVSRICFGSLTIGPSQKNFSIKEGANIILDAFNLGINFIDTAKSYGTYPYIKEALRISKRDDIIVASKSYAYTYDDMEKDLHNCLRSLGVNEMGIFLLHEQESELTLRGHRPALEYLVKAKEEGYIQAVGISTHTIAAVRAAIKIPEIDVIHPLINMRGIGIKDGSSIEMLTALRLAHDKGIGIYAMKPYAGGHLISSAKEALEWVLDQKCIDSIAVGMQSKEEVIANAAWSENQEISQKIKEKLRDSPRVLKISSWCEGCGKCAVRCRIGAIEIVNGKAVVDNGKCVLCGYCILECPEFCIKIF